MDIVSLYSSLIISIFHLIQAIITIVPAHNNPPPENLLYQRALPDQSITSMTIHHRRLENLTYPGGIPPYQSFDLYLPSTVHPLKPTQLLIYIHGGAWRSGDKADTHSLGLINNLSHQFPTAAICSVNYRLSIGKLNPHSQIQHPSHNDDVARAIDHLNNLAELKEIDEIYLIGHSVGAFIALSISGTLVPPSHSQLLALQLSTRTIQNIRGLILIDGIYHLPRLLQEYPNYSDFVVGAFGQPILDQPTSLHDLSPLSWSPSSKLTIYPSILILHSPDDSLLTIQQSELALTSLKSKLLSNPKIEGDFKSVTGDHNQLLLSPKLVARIKSFITLK